MPHPVWRDNMIREEGHFDDDDLWCDVIGGLYEGCPDSMATQRGIVAWNPPWDSKWVFSEFSSPLSDCFRSVEIPSPP